LFRSPFLQKNCSQSLLPHQIRSQLSFFVFSCHFSGGVYPTLKSWQLTAIFVPAHSPSPRYSSELSLRKRNRFLANPVLLESGTINLFHFFPFLNVYSTLSLHQCFSNLVRVVVVLKCWNPSHGKTQEELYTALHTGLKYPGTLKSLALRRAG